MTKNNINHYQNEFSSVWPDLPGYKVSWVDHLRLKAINDLTENGFPPSKAEDWKYTDLKNLLQIPFTGSQQTALEENWQKIETIANEIEAGMTLVFINGRFVKRIGRNQIQDGLEISSLSEAIAEQPEKIKSILASSEETATAFETLNTAFMKDGVYLRVKSNVNWDQPIQLLHLATESVTPLFFNTRNLFLFEDNAKATLIERYSHLQEKVGYLNNIVNSFVLGVDAQVDHYKIQDDNHQSFHLAVNRIDQETDSRFDSHAFAFGGRLSRNEVQVRLNGIHSKCSLKGLFMVDEERQTDNYTTLEHRVPDCKSEELYKGILDHHSKGVFRGKIKVEQDAQKNDARLSNANLLLSADAEVNTMPQLEIYADDVKCNHGSSTGQLDEDQLFYLLSRGVDATVARSMMIFAFANSIVDDVSSQAISSYLRSLIISKLNGSAEIKELI